MERDRQKMEKEELIKELKDLRNEVTMLKEALSAQEHIKNE